MTIDNITAAAKLASEQWPSSNPIEVTQDVFYYALEVLPPIYGAKGQFWMGEAESSGPGGPLYLEFWTENDRYYCRLSYARPAGAGDLMQQCTDEGVTDAEYDVLRCRVAYNATA